MVILTVSILLVNLALLAGLTACFLFLRARVSNLQDALAQFFDGNDDKPSEFALATDKVAQVFASRLVQSLSAMLAGMKSGANKQIAAAEREEIMAENPGLQMLGSFMPKLGKLNPALLMGLSQILGKVVGGKATAVASGNGSSPKFKL